MPSASPLSVIMVKKKPPKKTRRQLRHCNRKDMHPEVEYISYEVKPGKPLPGIEPHVDNASVITMVAMMANGKGYTGGVSCFEKGRRLRLERGDVVFFRECLRWRACDRQVRHSRLPLTRLRFWFG